MKINSLYISAFGGIKDLTLNFSEGFNVIYGDNENGKTTVMSFIKMMFYGSGRASSQLSKNIRQKYLPWDNSAMAGSIDFEHEGKKYRLEKEFRTSNSTDKATLCDLDFGTRQAVPTDVGLKFFGMSAAAFERSVFIGQFGFPEADTAAQGEINSKLSNIVSTGEENVSFETVSARLQKAKLSLMSKSGKTGEYDKNLKLHSEIKERIERSQRANEIYLEKKEKISLLEEEIKFLQKSADEIKTKISAEQDVRNAQKLENLLNLKQRLDSLNQTLKLSDGSIIDENYLKKLQFCISKVKSCSDKSNLKLSEIETLEKSLNTALNPPSNASFENAQKIEGEIKELENRLSLNKIRVCSLKNEKTQIEDTLPLKKRCGIKTVFLIASIISFVAALVFAFSNFNAFPLCTALILGAVFLSVYAVLSTKDRKRKNSLKKKAEHIENELTKLELEQSQIEASLNTKISGLETIKTALNTSAAVLENQKQMLENAKSEYEQLKLSQTEEESALYELFARYKKIENADEIAGLLDEISSKATKQKELKAELNFLLKDLDGISYSQAEEKLENIKSSQLDLSADFELLKNRYEQILSDLSDKKSEMATYLAEAKTLLSTKEQESKLKTQLEQLDKTVASQKEFCQITDLATEILTESFAELRRSYGSELEKKASKIFSQLTNGKYSGMTVSKAFDIGVEQTQVFGNRDIAYLSSGTADQAYLSLRLALSELMTENSDTLTVMLDDSLSQYDDSRLSLALSFLKSYSEKTQVIMFTCHKSISDAAGSIGAQCLTLKR